MLEPICEAEWILRGNTPYSRKRELESLLEDARDKVNRSLVDTFYKQINGLRLTADSQIDKSKGDITKLSFYEDLVKCHGYIADIEKYNNKGKVFEDHKIVTEAMANMKKLTKEFTTGYTVDSDVAKLMYSTLVMAIVDATSVMITNNDHSIFQAVLVTPTHDRAKSVAAVKKHTIVSTLSLDCLKKFNTAVKNGSIHKALANSNAVLLAKESTSVVKEELAAAAILGVVGVLIAIPLLRELVFYFYYARMQLADYLNQLSYYIKLNEVEVKNNGKFTPEEKKSIIEKQNKWIDKLTEISDKIRVKQSEGEVKAKTEIVKKNKEIQLDTVKQDIIASSNDGFQFE